MLLSFPIAPTSKEPAIFPKKVAISIGTFFILRLETAASNAFPAPVRSIIVGEKVGATMTPSSKLQETMPADQFVT